MNTEVKTDSQVLDKLVNELKQGFSSLAEKVKGDRGAAVEMFKQALAKAEKDELASAKAADLKKVKELCKKHGFSASSLKGYLKTRASKKTELDKGNAK
jgi:DNA-binding ferritin-like protein